MHYISMIFKELLSFEFYIMLPMFMLIIALIAGLNWKQGFHACLKLGIGFIGIFVMFAHFVDYLTPVLTAIIDKTGISMNVLEVGWPPLAAITWSFAYVPWLLVSILVANVIFFSLKWTKTINIDIWNYWHFMLIGQMVLYTTGSLLQGFIAAMVGVLVTLKVADWSSKDVEKFTGLKGISITTLPCVCYYPIGVLGNKLLDKITFIRELKADPDTIKSKLGMLGDAMVIGFMMGVGLGVAGGYEFKSILDLAFNIAAVVYILPIMTGILSEGILPISQAVQDKITRSFPRVKGATIGLHFAVILGDSAVIVTGIILMPIVLGLSFIIPGNRFLPLGSLPNMIGAVPIIVVACNRNILKSVIIGTVIMSGHFYVASKLAELYTGLAESVNYVIEGYNGLITSFLDGGNLMRYVVYRFFSMELNWIILISSLLVFAYVVVKVIKPKREIYQQSKKAS